MRILSTREKVLKINRNPSIYGSFAEIGAGQEVAASFFRAGPASGTIAKTISAYDMKFSDAIYGKTGKYVSKERLFRMLNKEFNLLTSRLPDQTKHKRFFAFADTVRTSDSKEARRGHSWMGLRFLCHPNSLANECIVHIVLNDPTSIQQQEVLGILGVNLIYACFTLADKPEKLLESLVDNIRPERIEIDLFKLTGPDFAHVDNRLLSLKLLKSGIARAVMFGKKGEVLLPSDQLYDKNVFIHSSRFRPITKVNLDMLRIGNSLFCAEADVQKKNVVVIAYLTLRMLDKKKDNEEQDFLNRVDLISTLELPVLVSNYYEYFDLVDYISQFTKLRKIGIVLGIYNLLRVFNSSHNNRLKKGLLESLGTLFGGNIKLYVYPAYKSKKGEGYLYNCSNAPLNDLQKILLEYLIAAGKVTDIDRPNKKNMNIWSDDVMEMIRNGEKDWEAMVPDKVAEMILQRKLFMKNSIKKNQ